MVNAKMNFNKFSNELRPLTVFNTNDIRKIDSNFNDENLCNWQCKGYITKLAKGCYTFADITVEKNLLNYAGNKIVTPSYISCETALAYYKVASLEDSITSVCPVKSYLYTSDYGGFRYHRINSDLMSNYSIVKHDNYFFRIATLEKAIVDFFFFNPKHGTREQIKTLDFNRVNLKEKAKPEFIHKVTEEYKNNSLTRRVRNFMHIFYE
jgi:predicted transcriptional regulator of viral defense system